MRRSSRPANRSPRLPASRPQREAMRRPRRSALLSREPCAGARSASLAHARRSPEAKATVRRRPSDRRWSCRSATTPRDTFLLIRGAYDKPGEKVTPGVPAVAACRCRKGRRTTGSGSRAGWSIPANPLTARVTVNRFWQMYFGAGLVKTVEDFGSQGEWPSHPELLDWLATEFVAHRLGRQGAAEDDRDERDVSAVVEGHAGAAAEGSREPAAGARPAVAAAGRGDPRSGARRRRAAGREASAGRR